MREEALYEIPAKVAWKRFLANKNIPLKSVRLLRDFEHDIVAIVEDSPGAKDLDRQFGKWCDINEMFSIQLFDSCVLYSGKKFINWEDMNQAPITSIEVTLLFNANLIERIKTKMTSPQLQFIINAKGKRTGVLLSLKEYQKLMEDLHDLAVIAERRDEVPMTLEEMKQRLEDNGLL